MSTTVCKPTIEDYCWLDGENPSSWKSWCPWQYVGNKGITRYNGYATVALLIEPFAEQAYIGSERKTGTRYRDYWLRINLNLPAGNFKDISELTIQKSGNISASLGWSAFLFKYQYNTIPSPIGTPPKDWLCTKNASTPLTPLNSISLSANKSLVAKASSNYDSKTASTKFNFPKFELLPNDDGIYYINIKLTSAKDDMTLSLGNSTLAYAPNTVNNNVKTLQSRLRELGYYSGSIDGKFGPRTKTAVINFQRARQLSADGMVGPGTKAELRYGSNFYEIINANTKWTCSSNNCTLTLQEYKVSYYSNNGESKLIEKSQAYNGSGIKIETNTFTKTGYGFVSWNTQSNGAGKTYQPEDIYNSTTPLTLYAQWKANEYNIKLRPALCYECGPEWGSSIDLSISNWAPYITKISHDGKEYNISDSIKVVYDQKDQITIEPNEYCDLVFDRKISAIQNDTTWIITVNNSNIDTAKTESELSFSVFPKHAYIKRPLDKMPQIWYYNQEGLEEEFNAIIQLNLIHITNEKVSLEETIPMLLGTKYKCNEKVIDNFEQIPKIYRYNEAHLEKPTILDYIWPDSMPEFALINEPYIYNTGWAYTPTGEPESEKESISLKQQAITTAYIYFTLTKIEFIGWDGNVIVTITPDQQNYYKIEDIVDGETPVKFWSLTKINGAPHYKIDDYLGLNKPKYTLYATTIKGRDFEIIEGE